MSGRRSRDERRYRSTTWHRAGGSAGDGAGAGNPVGDGDAGPGRDSAGGLTRSHPSHADAARRTERTIVHGLIVASVIVLVALMITVVWPAVSFLWSKARPVVDTLSTNAVYVGDGVTSVDGADRTEISRIIGTRPIAEIVLNGDDPLADDPLGTCEAVTDRLPELIVQVVVDGEFENGCEGDDIALTSGVDPETWDFRFWLEESYATELAGGDVPELSRQFALAYDAEVTGGRLAATEREFQPPPQRTVIALGVTAGVVVGTVLLFVLLRLVTRWAFKAADRRGDWEHRRDEIDGELGDIALIMVTVRPDLLSDRALSTAIGEVAGDYDTALERLAQAGPGDDLTELAESVRGIRARLTAAGAPA